MTYNLDVETKTPMTFDPDAVSKAPDRTWADYEREASSGNYWFQDQVISSDKTSPTVAENALAPADENKSSS